MKKYCYLLLSVFFFLPFTAMADYNVTTGASSNANQIDMSTGNNTNGGQVFGTVGAGTIASASFCLGNNGLATGNVLLDLYASSGNNPTGSSLGTASIPASSITGNAPYNFTFGSPISVSGTTNYVMVVSRDTISVGSIKGCGSSHSPNDGVYSDDNGSSWNALGAQFDMVVSVTEGGGGGGGGGTATSTYNCVKASSSTDCLVQVIDYPVLDVFLGYVLYIFVAIGIVWFTTLIL